MRCDRPRHPARRGTTTRCAALGLVLCLGLFLTACLPGRGSAPAARGGLTVRVATYDFGESQTLGQLYAQALRRAGFRVEVIDRIGTREVVMPAFEQGRVDVVVDYVGSALAFLDPARPVAYGSTEAAQAALQARLSPRGISALNPAAAQDQNGFAITNGTATTLGVSRLSQLKGVARTLKFGGPPECTARPFCLPGLERVYGITFNSFTAMESRYATAAALASKEIDVGMLETTDARLAPGQFTLLDDDLKLQPRENVVPLVRTRLLERGGGRLKNALNEVSSLLTTDRLIAMNKAVEIDGRNASEVTAEWLAAYLF